MNEDTRIYFKDMEFFFPDNIQESECYGILVTIHPDNNQKEPFKQTVGSQRWIWNYFLSDAKSNQILSYKQMCEKLTKVKNENEWLNDIQSQTLQQTLKRLSKAFKAFKNSKFGFPKFKIYGKSVDSACFPQYCTADKEYLYLPKIGKVKYSGKDISNIKIKNVTIYHDKNRDRWIAAICTEKSFKYLPKTGESVGLDAGSVRLVTDSDGNFEEALRNIPQVAKLLKRIEHEQKKLSDINEKLKVNNYRYLKIQRKRKQKTLNTLHRKLANFCKDVLHKSSKNLVENNDFIAVEDLKIKNMTKSAKGTIENPGKNVAQKSGLNRNLLSNRISMFYAMIEYKCQRYGKHFVKVNPRYTSQTCSVCGFKHKNNRPDQATFKCQKCGHEMNADQNAAINILKKGIFQAIENFVTRHTRRVMKRLALPQLCPMLEASGV